MRFRLILVLIPFIFSLFTVSCTKYKNVPYFQDLKRDSVNNVKGEAITNYAPFTIQKGDLLAVQVSSLNREADALINYNLERPNATATAVGRPEENSVYGYLVDRAGNIKLAYIGELKVEGFTIDQLTAILQEKLSVYLKSPVVNIRLQNFRVSVLGDVKAAGVYYTQNERLSILEALGLAGDLNATGMRKNVLLIREVNGERQYVTIDLTSKKVINSPYYYLKSGDVVYVPPSREKVQASDSAFQKASILVSALSLVAIFITRYN